MSNAIIVYNLDDYDERIDFERVIRAKDLCSVMWDIKEHIFRIVDDNREGLPECCISAIEKLHDYIHELLSDSNVNIDELWA